jgi:hypothetical protein
MYMPARRELGMKVRVGLLVVLGECAVRKTDSGRDRHEEIKTGGSRYEPPNGQLQGIPLNLAARPVTRK